MFISQTYCEIRTESHGSLIILNKSQPGCINVSIHIINTEYIMTNPFIMKNTISGENIFKSHPINEEVFFDGGMMITETDTKGIITYTNRNFREMTGYTKEELIGSPHSINRHPDMPKGAFRGMWKTIVQKKVWHGYVKNIRKDGKFYWVIVYIQSKLDENGNIIGFIAGRKIPNRNVIKEIEEKYAELHDDQYMDHKFFMSGELMLDDNTASRG